MADLNRWWLADPEERYWIEITNRADVGANLNAPATNERDEPFWSYDLIHEVEEGDIVYHYDANAKAITGHSTAVGSTWPDQVLWVARGTSARKQGLKAHPRPGFYRGLTDFTPLAKPVTKATLLQQAQALISVRDGVRKKSKGAAYFPFTPHRKEGLRAFQGYLTKLPKAVFAIVPELIPATGPPIITKSANQLGQEYRRPDEQCVVGERDPFAVDPALVERALRGHASTQNKLAEFVISRGWSPRSPSPQEANFDLAWEAPGSLFVAEVKSCTDDNQERQLRLGLGQVLRYRDRLERAYGKPTVAVLMLECAPMDSSWIDLCSALAVELWWPGHFGSH